MLVGRRHHLVLGPEVEAGDDDVAAVRRRAGQRDLVRVDADEGREPLTQPVAQPEHVLEVRLPEPTVGGGGPQLVLHRVDRRPCQRPERPRIQVRDPLERREERSRLLDRHPTRASTGA